MLQREYVSLTSESDGIAKRLWWLLGANILGFAGCMRLFAGGATGDEFKHAFGEFGETAAIWALLIGSVWLAADLWRGRTIKARSHVIYLELSARGFAYDFSSHCWASSAENLD